MSEKLHKYTQELGLTEFYYIDVLLL